MVSNKFEMQFPAKTKWAFCMSYPEDAFHDLGECLIIKSMEMEGFLFDHIMAKHCRQLRLYIEDIMKIEFWIIAKIA